MKHQLKNILTLSCLLASFFFLSAENVCADAAAEKVLKRARWATSAQQQDLKGQLRKGSKKYPVHLFLRNNDIQFAYFVGKNVHKFHLKLKEGKADLWDVTNNKWRKFNHARMVQSIQQTDLTFEDLAMSFLYWKNSKLVREELVKGQKCQVVRLQNPGKKGKYALVYAWIHKRNGALMKVVGYNKKGKPLSRFQAESVMKVGKNYTIKKMSVKSYHPKTGKNTGTTYLQFFKPKKKQRSDL